MFLELYYSFILVWHSKVKIGRPGKIVPLLSKSLIRKEHTSQ